MNATLPKISIVIVSYERLSTLQITLASLLNETDYPRDRLEVIVADDGSGQQVLDAIKKLSVDKIVIGGPRSGLGANVNRGIAAASHDFILQIQDDWECVGPPDYLRQALNIFNLRPEVGMVLMNAHPKDLPTKSNHRIDDYTVKVHVNRPKRLITMVGKHAYTDWPHLKTKAFIEEIGPYKEKVPMWETELDYSRRVNSQSSWFIAEVTGAAAFRHIGENLSFNTGSFRQRLFGLVRKIPGASLVLDKLKRVIFHANDD
jgi:GT2 family glycosyltransferase